MNLGLTSRYPQISIPIGVRLGLHTVLNAGEFSRYLQLCNTEEASDDAAAGNKSIIFGLLYGLISLDTKYAKTVASETALDEYFDFETNKSNFRELMWLSVNPRILLSILEDKGTSPIVFRETIQGGHGSSLHVFASSYQFHRRGMSGSAWSELARWIFVDAQPSELTLEARSPVPIVFGSYQGVCQVGYLAYGRTPLGVIMSGLSYFQDLQKKWMLYEWLGDLAAAGVDLVEYGELETKSAKGFWQKHTMPSWDLTWPYFLYGPHPEDWRFFFREEIFDFKIEEYVEEFWRLVEPVEIHIPGSWINEDDE